MKITDFVTGIGALVVIIVIFGLAIFLVPWLVMLLWNDLAPVFGVGTRLTWFKAFEILVLLNLLKQAWKTDVKVPLKDMKSKF